MKVKEITFALAQTTPLQTYTGSMTDQYSNVKPYAAVTIEIEDGDDPAVAFERAQELVFAEIGSFHDAMKTQLKPV